MDELGIVRPQFFESDDALRAKIVEDEREALQKRLVPLIEWLAVHKRQEVAHSLEVLQRVGRVVPEDVQQLA